MQATSSPGGILRIPTARAFLRLLPPRQFKGAKGGRGAAKSHFFCERLVEEMVAQHTRVACLREIQDSIKDSVKQLVEDKIRKLNLSGGFRITEREISGPNDSLMVFKGLKGQTATSIKSLEGYTRAFVEEAQTIRQSSLDILVPTIRAPGSEIWFSWNPNSPKDPVDKFFAENDGDPDFICIDVTYADNPWFPAELRRSMERDRKRDPEKYAHIWLGKYRQMSEARVFKNVRIDTLVVPDGCRPYFGGDWGFSVDPSVLSRCYLIEPRTLYFDAEAYQVGCEVDKLPKLFDSIDDGMAREWPITADSARPETISYMKRHGYPHIKPAVKGAGSLEDGVEFLKSYDIVVHPRCKHTIDEFTHYSYKVDKLTGDVLPILADKDNNVIDSARYATEGVRMARVGETDEREFVFEPKGVKFLSDLPRVYGIDVKGSRVSVVWGSWDQKADVVYLYAEYVEDRERLETWASSIRKRGKEIPGVFEIRGRNRSEEQGERLVDRMVDEQLDIFTSEADTESAADEINSRIRSKQLRVASSMTGWLAEYRSYRRDAKDQIVPESDGLMRATGLLLVGGLSIATVDKVVAEEAMEEWSGRTRKSRTGY